MIFNQVCALFILCCGMFVFGAFFVVIDPDFRFFYPPHSTVAFSSTGLIMLIAVLFIFSNAGARMGEFNLLRAISVGITAFLVYFSICAGGFLYSFHIYKGEEKIRKKIKEIEDRD